MLKRSLLVLCFVFNFNLLADENMERIPVESKCDEEVMRCTYVPQNLTARVLSQRIKGILKPDDILLPTEGYVKVENNIIAYWFFNEELRTRFEGLLPLMDVLEDFVPSHLVQLTTEIFSMSEDGLNNVEATLSHAGSDTTDVPDFDILNTGGLLDLTLNVSSNLLGAVMGSQSTRKESTKMTKVVQLIPNLAGVNYSRTTNIYVSPTPGFVKEEQAGLTIGGTVSINGADPNLVIVRDYSFRYGVHRIGGEANDQVTVLSITNPQLYLYNGTSSMIVSSHTEETTRGTNWGVLSFGRNSSKTFSKLMVVTRAKAISFENYRRDMSRFSELSLFRTFGENQVNKLPSSTVSVNKVLESIQPYAYMTHSGDRIIGFKLDPKLASKDLIKKDIQISVRGGGIKMKKYRSVENLMLSGFKFDSLTERYLGRSKVKIKITLKRNGARLGDNVKKTIYYDPDRNTFLN